MATNIRNITSNASAFKDNFRFTETITLFITKLVQRTEWLWYRALNLPFEQVSSNFLLSLLLILNNVHTVHNVHTDICLKSTIKTVDYIYCHL